MQLTGTHQEHFSFTVQASLCPEVPVLTNQTDRDKANAMLVAIRIQHPLATVEQTALPMSRWELWQLLNFFESLSGEKESPAVWFDEIGLYFQLRNGAHHRTKRVRISFDEPLKPSSIPFREEFFMEVLLDQEELNNLVKDFRAQLEPFPYLGWDEEEEEEIAMMDEAIEKIQRLMDSIDPEEDKK
jgi:hypothetical protein